MKFLKIVNMIKVNKNSVYDAVIIAGGFGSRLKKKIPKALVKINNKPIIQHQIEALKQFDLKNILIVLHYGSEKIKNFLGSGEQFGVNLNFFLETVPLGSGGALFKIFPLMKRHFFVVFCDVYFDVDFVKFKKFHLRKNSLLTLFTHPNDHPADSDIVIVDKTNKVINFSGYPHKDLYSLPNLVTAGLFLFDKNLFKLIKSPNSPKMDLTKELVPYLLSKKIEIFSYKSSNFIKDMGTPRRLKEVSSKLKSNLLNTCKTTIFFDRDGVIIENVDNLSQLNSIKFINGYRGALKKVKSNNALSFLVTNQPSIAKGFVTEEQVHKIHNYIEQHLGQNGLFFDDIKFCPHHPENGFKNEISNLKINCNCRKPKIGMFKELIKNHKFDLKNSWIIGDMTTDIRAGEKLGIKTILLRTGFGGMDGKINITPDFIFNDISKSVDWIFDLYPKLINNLLKFKDIFLKNKYFFISGESFSGKSTFSSTLKYFLDDQDAKLHIISLDGFLLPFEKRNKLDSNQSFLDKYDLSSIYKLTQDIQKGKKKKLTIPFYDKNNLKIFKKQILLNSKDKFIFDGIIAFVISKSFSKKNSISIFAEGEKNSIKKEFLKKYKLRGYHRKKIKNLFNYRNENEVAMIFRYKNMANFIYNSSKNDLIKNSI